MLSLDLVITVDTVTAHLAGALGVPVWILLPFAPDWRWVLDRTGHVVVRQRETLPPASPRRLGLGLLRSRDRTARAFIAMNSTVALDLRHGDTRRRLERQTREAAPAL